MIVEINIPDTIVADLLSQLPARLRVLMGSDRATLAIAHFMEHSFDAKYVRKGKLTVAGMRAVLSFADDNDRSELRERLDVHLAHLENLLRGMDG